jgi:hypothetical protein
LNGDDQDMKEMEMAPLRAARSKACKTLAAVADEIASGRIMTAVTDRDDRVTETCKKAGRQRTAGGSL